ncbi:MAG: hypothetical protein HQ541_03485 [Mariniphaga sp.]|nr:hypothetical protein [Mariniphaga sp.]
MKKLIYLSIIAVLFSACEKNMFDEHEDLSLKKVNKITICHNGHPINISINALKVHLNHGDEILDADGDGFSAIGACSGSMDDCDDNDASIFPGAEEICGDGIDNNCNGEVDENCNEGTMTDSDGNIYKTVIIGDQEWMAENMALYVEDGSWAYDNDETNVTTYGRLYNWETAQNVCPADWHLPTQSNWNKLAGVLGGRGIAGGKMKEEGLSHWSPNTGASNESGFTGLPGGFYDSDFNSTGLCINITRYGLWWSATQLRQNANNSYCNGLGSYSILLTILNYPKNDGLSVRCVKD